MAYHILQVVVFHKTSARLGGDAQLILRVAMPAGCHRFVFVDCLGPVGVGVDLPEPGDPTVGMSRYTPLPYS